MFHVLQIHFKKRRGHTLGTRAKHAEKAAGQRFQRSCASEQFAPHDTIVLRSSRLCVDLKLRGQTMQGQMRDGLPARIRIVAVDEHELFRAGLTLLLSQQSGFEMAGSASSLRDAVAVVQREKPDLVLVSLGASGTGIEFLPDLAAVSETSKVLVLLDSGDQELLRKAVRLGATGVLSKRTPAATLVKAIECVHAGEAWLDRSSTAALLRELSPRNRPAKQDPQLAKIASLTEREREVIRLVGEGLKNKQIAEKLFISDITVHHHLTSIYSKLEVADRLELLIFAYRNKLAELPGSG